MSGSIYLVGDDQHLVEMVEQPYSSEDLLQNLLADYPNLLAGDQLDGDAPRRWLLVSRELSLPGDPGGVGRWAVDHLFLDQDGIPTIVEVKRSTDSRVRREVVGQMLEYAANAVAYWPVERVISEYEDRCRAEGLDPADALAPFLGPDGDPQRFWQDVKTNLQAGRLRMIFVADQIPPELQRIVDFLAAQLDPARIYAVEVKQYVGQGLQALVPRLVSTPAGVRDVAVGPATRWDLSSFVDVLARGNRPENVAVFQRLLAWMRERSLRIEFGRGMHSGSCYPKVYLGRSSWSLFSVWTGGEVEIEFGTLLYKAPFDDVTRRLALLDRLNHIPGVAISPDSITRYPKFPLAVLTEPAALAQFFDTFDWVIAGIRGQPGD